MALQVTSQDPKMMENVGAYSGLVTGIVSSSGTTTTVTVTSLSAVHGVIVSNMTSATTLPYCDTTSSNTFTVTHGNGDEFSYICWGTPRI